RSLQDMTAYFRAAIREQERSPRGGLLLSLMTAEVDGARLSEEEVIANAIVTMVGGQETTTNLIGNGLLTLLRHPAQLAQLRDDPAIIESAVEELLRYESPSQHTARLVPDDMPLGGKSLRKRDAVMAVMAAGNRDPKRFPDPDRLDLTRKDNRHLAFGWAAHFCFGAPLARIEGQVAFATLLRRLPNLAFEPVRLEWRENLGLRGLHSLPGSFNATGGTGVPRQRPAVAELPEAKRVWLKRFLRGDERRDRSTSDRVTPRPAQAMPPISPEQRQVWLHAVMAPDLPLYNEAITIHRKGS